MNLTEWKELKETQELMLGTDRRINDCIEQLVGSAGVDPRRDSFLAGVIAALRDVVEIKFEETHDN